MDLNRLRLLVAAPMASLFLVLGLCAFVLQRPGAAGMNLPLPKVKLDSVSNCDFLCNRDLVVQLRKDGSTWINETQVSAKELHSELTEIYSYRAEKFTYMISDPDVSFGMFANFYNIVASSTSNLHILLKAPGLEKEFQQCQGDTSCGLNWPDGYYQSCVWFKFQPLRIRPNSLRWPGRHN